MDKHELTELLNHVADGSISPDDAALKLKIQPFQEIGEYAKVDFHRGIRQGRARGDLRRREGQGAYSGHCEGHGK